MNRITRLVHGKGTVSDLVWHSRKDPEHLPDHLLAFSHLRRPVVFWNMTAACNLSCSHCYINAGPERPSHELTTEEARNMLEDLATMKVPLLILTGGEPLMRGDFWEIVSHARNLELRIAISSNGTLISRSVARKLREEGVVYVGISLDGATQETHDSFRGAPESYHRAIAGIQACIQEGLHCGIRFTVTRDNLGELEDLIQLSRRLEIPRFCLYWLVPSGRGEEIRDLQLKAWQVPSILDILLQATQRFGTEMEFLTVDGPQDTAYILQRIQEEVPENREDAQALARMAGGGCSAGERIANIDPRGNVYPCQFAQLDQFKIGNVRERLFSELWNDAHDPVLSSFRHKGDQLHPTCQTCRYMPECGGGCRIRAYEATGDLWGMDPLCPIQGRM